jgi:hypothetical protein
MSNKVMTPEFRLSFPSLFEPTSFEGGEPKYRATMIFDKKQDLTALKKLAQDALEERWPDPKKRPKNLKWPFRDGDEEREGLEGYDNTIFVSTTSNKKPGVVDQNVQDIVTPEDIYAGCYARATVTAFSFDKSVNKGVAFGLQNLQKLRDGDTFSGKASAANDFEAVASNSTPTTEKEESWMK